MTTMDLSDLLSLFNPNRGNRRARQVDPIPVEEQLSTLAALGLTLTPGIHEHAIYMFHTREELAQDPYRKLAETMGHDCEETTLPICPRLWMCDCERVEGPGSYVQVLERLERMTDGALGLRNLRDHVELEGEPAAWVTFEYQDEDFQLDLEVDDDWLDAEVLYLYDELLGEVGSERRLYVASEEEDYGQVAYLGAFAEGEAAQFGELTEVAMKPLAEDQ